MCAIALLWLIMSRSVSSFSSLDLLTFRRCVLLCLVALSRCVVSLLFSLFALSLCLVGLSRWTVSSFCLVVLSRHAVLSRFFLSMPCFMFAACGTSTVPILYITDFNVTISTYSSALCL